MSNNYRNLVYAMTGQPVFPQYYDYHQTPTPRERTVREDLEEVVRQLEGKERQQSLLPKQPPYLEFNGKELSWYDNGQRYRSWPAMSGNKNYQSPEYQNVANNGPIPEGNWKVRQDRFQRFDDLSSWDKTKSTLGGGKWPGGKYAWGNYRIWLEPEEGVNTYGRTGLTIHGGNEFGSAGCIDLENGMDDFANTFRKYGQDMQVRVKYPKSGW